MSARRSTSQRFASELAHPLPVIAVIALLVNDHALKGTGALPAWLTGKLSDFAGLFFFPILLFVLVDALGRACGGRGFRRDALALACGMATALVFAVLKLHAGFNALACALWGPIVLDPSDLLALPMCCASVWWLVGRDSDAHPALGSSAVRHAIVVLASLASIATPPPQHVRNYPAWELTGKGPWPVGCATVDAWVSKSGKQGVGLTLELRAATAGSCEVRVQRTSIEIAGRTIEASQLPDAVRVDTRPRQLYLPFAFDNEASWNRKELAAVLTVDLSAGGQAARLQRDMIHRWDGPHRWVPRSGQAAEPDEDAGAEPDPSAEAR
jgi:hypothetical protein